MAIFAPPATSKRTASNSSAETALGREPDANEFSFNPVTGNGPAATVPMPIHAAHAPERELKESLVAANLSIEGKIQGAGHIRIAGRFKGDVQVDGDLTIELGAKVNGGVRARRVIVAGELEGNIESAERVELLPSAAMTGDIKAGTVTVAAGARMRGQVEFGWDDAAAAKPASRIGVVERDVEA
jgi:cytoskeletal protein CcmA (bactofilin family)